MLVSGSHQTQQAARKTRNFFEFGRSAASAIKTQTQRLPRVIYHFKTSISSSDSPENNALSSLFLSDSLKNGFPQAPLALQLVRRTLLSFLLTFLRPVLIHGVSIPCTGVLLVLPCACKVKAVGSRSDQIQAVEEPGLIHNGEEVHGKEVV